MKIGFDSFVVNLCNYRQKILDRQSVFIINLKLKPIFISMKIKKDISYTIQEQINLHLKQIEKIKKERDEMIEKYDGFILTQKEIVDFLKSKSGKISAIKSKKLISSKGKKRNYTLQSEIENGLISILKENSNGIQISEIRKKFIANGKKVSIGALDRNIKRMLENKIIKIINPEAKIGFKYAIETGSKTIEDSTTKLDEKN